MIVKRNHNRDTPLYLFWHKGQVNKKGQVLGLGLFLFIAWTTFVLRPSQHRLSTNIDLLAGVVASFFYFGWLVLSLKERYIGAERALLIQLRVKATAYLLTFIFLGATSFLR